MWKVDTVNKSVTFIRHLPTFSLYLTHHATIHGMGEQGFYGHLAIGESTAGECGGCHDSGYAVMAFLADEAIHEQTNN